MRLNLGKIVKAAVKYGPIIYPVVKKVLDRKSSKKPTTRTTRHPK